LNVSALLRQTSGLKDFILLQKFPAGVSGKEFKMRIYFSGGENYWKETTWKT
jgi:hypothetical protein